MDHPARNSRNRGAVTIEFALVALVFYVLVAGLLSMSTAVLSQQVAQDAARVGARELALRPFPADATFEEALREIFDPEALVIDLDTLPADVSFDEVFATLPVLHRALRPLYIFERVEIDGAERRLLRYPGAIVRLTNDALSVAIPRVVSRGATGVEQIEWRSVVEEVRPDLADPATGSFAFTDETNGIVALRIWVPYQSSALSGFGETAAGPLEPNISRPIVADDAAVSVVSTPDFSVVDTTSEIPTYAGAYGLGVQQVLGREVRPFRVLLVGQALFRREVFE